MAKAYAERFSAPADARVYDNVEYAAGTYAQAIWEMEQPWLAGRLNELRRRRSGLRLLDFACGTGRILSFVEDFAAESHGLDLSAAMVRAAASRCRRSALFVGDLLSDPALVRGPYDVITVFRFLLNVEAPTRAAVLRALRGRIREPDGVLIADVHGNRQSLRHPAVLWKRLLRRLRPTPERLDQMLAEMSPGEAGRLLVETGWRVVSQHGFGLLPPTLYRTPLRRLARALDRRCAGRPAWRNCSINVIFVCQPTS